MKFGISTVKQQIPLALHSREGERATKVETVVEHDRHVGDLASHSDRSLSAGKSIENLVRGTP